MCWHIISNHSIFSVNQRDWSGFSYPSLYNSLIPLFNCLAHFQKLPLLQCVVDFCKFNICLADHSVAYCQHLRKPHPTVHPCGFSYQPVLKYTFMFLTGLSGVRLFSRLWGVLGGVCKRMSRREPYKYLDAVLQWFWWGFCFIKISCQTWMTCQDFLCHLPVRLVLCRRTGQMISIHSVLFWW